MYKFLYDYIKKKYGDEAHLFYINTNKFIIHIKTKDFHEIVKDDVNVSYLFLWNQKTFNNRGKIKKLVVSSSMGRVGIIKKLTGLKT